MKKESAVGTSVLAPYLNGRKFHNEPELSMTGGVADCSFPLGESSLVSSEKLWIREVKSTTLIRYFSDRAILV